MHLKNVPLILILLLFATLSHAETLIEYQGRKYRVEPNPELHQIKAYSEFNQKPYPTSLVLVLTQKNHLQKKIRLYLTETTRDSVVYSGLIPSKVLISGGIRFDIGDSK
jgi:hypothetical protein